MQRSIRQFQHGVMAVLLGEIGIVEQHIDSANGRRDLLQRVIGSIPTRMGGGRILTPSAASEVSVLS